MWRLLSDEQPNRYEGGFIMSDDERNLGEMGGVDWDAVRARTKEAMSAAEGDNEFLAEEMMRIQEEFGVGALPDADAYRGYLEKPSTEKLMAILQAQLEWNMTTDRQLEMSRSNFDEIEKAFNTFVELLSDLLVAAADSPKELQRFARKVLSDKSKGDCEL